MRPGHRLFWLVPDITRLQFVAVCHKGKRSSNSPLTSSARINDNKRYKTVKNFEEWNMLLMLDKIAGKIARNWQYRSFTSMEISKLNIHGQFDMREGRNFWTFLIHRVYLRVDMKRIGFSIEFFIWEANFLRDFCLEEGF